MYMVEIAKRVYLMFKHTRGYF